MEERSLWDYLVVPAIRVEAWRISWRRVEALRELIPAVPPSQCTCGGCRYWTGPLRRIKMWENGQLRWVPKGYPVFWLPITGERRQDRPTEQRGSWVNVGRIVIALRDGVMPEDKEASHICPCGPKKLCVAEAHLQPETPLENKLRIIIDGNGHDPALAAMLRSILEKARENPTSLTPRELRFVRVVEEGNLVVTETGEISQIAPPPLPPREVEDEIPF